MITFKILTDNISRNFSKLCEKKMVRLLEERKGYYSIYALTDKGVLKIG